ncbi:WXG100 family type VII secretion target [Glycomyces terrestris]|uniref:ESAT-6-like protein n=1 Tax=Glycomyces terrestris TaxID=2493553 RepID=A0A426UWT8_9ACTN|nr:WXG100 family type VII secretion target [Glycomyces terrestris]RRR99082.1 WXG100 family type VII secretion target [Glycomyces terrestris]
MSGRIAMDYAELEAASQQIATESGEMTSTLADLRSQLEALDWEGDDKATYEEAKAQWDQAFEEINAILEAVGRAVNNAKERYAATEAANAGRFGG